MVIAACIEEEKALELIALGWTQARIAQEFGTSQASYQRWIHASPVRLSLVREAETKAAHAYVHLSVDEFDAASDQFELSKAREKALHLRWMAARFNRPVFGDKIENIQDTRITIQLVQFDSAGLPLVQDISNSIDKQALMGGDSSGSVGVALGNPTSTATHGLPLSAHGVQSITDVPLKEHEQVSVDISEDEYKPVVMNMDSIPGREARLEKRRIAKELARKARKDEYWRGRGYIWNGEKYVKDTRPPEQVVSDAKRKWDSE
jgi:transcriptional regulator with XRE-family HTH domain